jgi:hypothetical protein
VACISSKYCLTISRSHLFLMASWATSIDNDGEIRDWRIVPRYQIMSIYERIHIYFHCSIRRGEH